MVTRAFLPVTAGAALVLPLVLLGGFRPAPAEALSGASFGARDKEAAEVVVEWVIRSYDLVACQTVTPDLRRARHQHGDRLRIVTYAVETDTALVRSFLRRERLARVETVAISESVFQRDFAHRFPQPLRTPSLIVVSRTGRTEAFDAGVRLASGRRAVEEFRSYISGLLDTPEREPRSAFFTTGGSQ